MGYQPRKIDETTLNKLSVYYAGEFPKSSLPHPRVEGRWAGGRSFVMDNLYNMTYRDEQHFVVDRIRSQLNPEQEAEFVRAAANRFEPRRTEVFEGELLKHLAINPAGEHVAGHVGKIEIGRRVIGTRMVAKKRWRFRERTLKERFLFLNGTLMNRVTFSRWKKPELIAVRLVPRKVTWPVYRGEMQERKVGSDVVDPLPEGALPFSLLPGEFLALNPTISNLAAIDACDAIVDRLDLGATAAVIRGRTGAQPANPDATETGTLLFTLTMSATAFGAAADDTGKATATAASITGDSSADDTDTVGYCRCASAGAGADDEVDGEAGSPSGADFNFNSVAIAAGASVDMSAFTISISE